MSVLLGILLSLITPLTFYYTGSIWVLSVFFVFALVLIILTSFNFGNHLQDKLETALTVYLPSSAISFFILLVVYLSGVSTSYVGPVTSYKLSSLYFERNNMIYYTLEGSSSVKSRSVTGKDYTMLRVEYEVNGLDNCYELTYNEVPKFGTWSAETLVIDCTGDVEGTQETPNHL
jgi:hypothetical protein